MPYVLPANIPMVKYSISTRSTNIHRKNARNSNNPPNATNVLTWNLEARLEAMGAVSIEVMKKDIS